MVLGYGCEGEPEEVTTASDENTATIGVQVNMNAGSSYQMFNAVGTADEIAAITVEAVNTTDETVITSTSLENIAGTWAGILSSLPYNVSIRFQATALNADEVAIFSGTMLQTLVEGGENSISINLSSIDDAVQPDNPIIASVSMPQKVLVDSEPQRVAFQVDFHAEVAYTITVSAGQIADTFDGTPSSSLSGIYDPAGELEIFFIAPSDPVVAQLTITVRDLEASDEVGANFYLEVVSYDPDTWTDSDVSVVVGPAITDMAFSRSETNLRLLVTASPDSGLTQEWTGTGDFAGLNASGNPIFLMDFTDEMAGEITVTVRDANNLEAFITRTIHAGDYPYTVNEYILDMPGIYIFDETTLLLWQDNTNKVSKKWARANTTCSNLNLVGYTNWRLPTKNELVNMFDRKGDFSNYYELEYWSADQDPDERSRAITVSFSDGSEESQSKTRKKLVRCVKN